MNQWQKESHWRMGSKKLCPPLQQRHLCGHHRRFVEPAWLPHFPFFFLPLPASPEILTNRINIRVIQVIRDLQSVRVSESRCSCDYGGTCLQGCQRTWHSHLLHRSSNHPRSSTHPRWPCPPPALPLLSTLVAALVCPEALRAQTEEVVERTHICVGEAENASFSLHLYLRPNAAHHLGFRHQCQVEEVEKGHTVVR